MKRKNLIDRASLLHSLQENLADAARVFTKRDADTNSGRSYIEQARRDLLNAAIRYGVTCKRYLGGRTDG